MSSSYECKKCTYKTERYCNIYKHLIKKKQCKKNIESFNYSDDQVLILSLLPIENNDFNEKKLEYLKNSDIIYKNKDKLLSMIEYVDKNKLKKCSYCNEDFSKICDLKNHILLSCFYNELNKNNNISLTNNNCNNNNNNNNNSNNNIINNIFIEINNPVPFDDDWDISKISDDKKASLLISKIMYTGLLEEILKNEINLNIIIDKNNDSGMVYKNDVDQYIQMKSKDIVNNTMKKLQKHLLDINNECVPTCIEDFLKDSKKVIVKKHSDYVRDNGIQKNVQQFISNILESKKEEAIKMSKNIIIKKYEKEGF